MQDTLKDLESNRYICKQLIAEAKHYGLPLMLGHYAACIHLKNEGIPVPTDVLAWISGGAVSDASIKDWHHPTGGF